MREQRVDAVDDRHPVAEHRLIVGERSLETCGRSLQSTPDGAPNPPRRIVSLDEVELVRAEIEQLFRPLRP